MGSNQTEKQQHAFTWKIENFSMCTKKKGDAILSPTFKAKSFDEASWFMKLYPYGTKSSPVGYTSCFITRREDDVVPADIECECIIEIIDKDNHSVTCKKSVTKFSKGKCFGWPDYIKTDELVKTAGNDDTLIIRCTLLGNVTGMNSSSLSNVITKLRTSKHSFQWAVNVSKSAVRQEVVKFPGSGSSLVEITITIPKNDDSSDNDSDDQDSDTHIQICMKIKDNFSCSRFVVCRFTLLDVEGKERDSRRATHLFELLFDSKTRHLFDSKTWDFPAFIKKNELKNKKAIYLKNGCFTLNGDFIVSDGTIEEREEKPVISKFTTSFKDTKTDLNEDIRRLHVDKSFTDVKLRVAEQVFTAHKCILYARSPIFFGMLNQDKVEGPDVEVSIPELEAKTMELFLEYIYTGTVIGLDCENAMKLIVAADKYQVLSLKDKCAEFLASKLSDASVCEVLVTADLVRQDTLKAFTFDYIRKQPAKVFNSETWKNCAKTHLDLATETICEVSKLWGEHSEE